MIRWTVITERYEYHYSKNYRMLKIGSKFCKKKHFGKIIKKNMVISLNQLKIRLDHPI